MHIGGGKTLIIDFINDAMTKNHIDFVIYIDKRLTVSKKIPKHIKIIPINKILRFALNLYLFFKLEKEDIIVFLGNLPPIISLRCWTLLLQSNRFLIENVTTKGMKIKVRLKIFIERIHFQIFKTNVDEIVVQSKIMKEILDFKTKGKINCSIIAYKNIILKSNKKKEKKYDFIYIASDEHYKNHDNLLKAWIRLYNDKIYSSLCLVVPKNSCIKEKVNILIKQYNKLEIFVFDDDERNLAVTKLKNSRTLVYPSKFEAYGLPIVEANMNNLKIIASEKDYVRDLLDPDETFDPESSMSIYRAVKRFLNKNDEKTHVVDASFFIDFIASKGNLIR